MRLFPGGGRRFTLRHGYLFRLLILSAISLISLWWFLAPLDIDDGTYNKSKLPIAVPNNKREINLNFNPLGVQLSDVFAEQLRNKIESKRSPLIFKDGHFILSEAKIRFLSGAIHYFRVVPEYWEDRLYKLKAAGLNTVETYVAWNAHEEIKGVFNFDGILNIRKFIKAADALGLFVILRPGPYICSEWELGGLPSWLLRHPGMKLRTNDRDYLAAVNTYFYKLMMQIKDLQWSNGGPIVAMQVENEYGAHAADKNHMKTLKQMMRDNGVSELLFTSDNKHGLELGSTEGVLKTANFKTIPTGRSLFELMRHLQPDAPLMVTEFWTGWFDAWGNRKHNIMTPQEMEKVLKFIIKEGASFNLYMFHGGTNFGFMNGANGATGVAYNSLVTSYDYDAPLSEHGATNDKYGIIKNLLSNLSHSIKGMPYPDPVATLKYGPVKIIESLLLPDLLTLITTTIQSDHVMNMESLEINNGSGQAYGYIVYRTHINQGQKLSITDRVYDQAHLFVDNKPIGVMNAVASNKQFTLPPLKAVSVLDILVENLGRKNYGLLDDQRKGLMSPILIDGKVISQWEIFPLEFKPDLLKRVSFSDKWQNKAMDTAPALFKGTFQVDTKADTFLDMNGWSRCVAFVNGNNIGRYWNLGPQRTLYVPAPFLKVGDNEVMIFELLHPAKEVIFQESPVLG